MVRFGPPSVLQQLPKARASSSQGAMPLTGILSTVHPRVMVIAADHPFVGDDRCRGFSR